MDSKIETIYSNLEKEIKITLRPEYKELVNFQSNENIPIHRWFSIKEGYSRDLIISLFRRFGITRKNLIMDPFSGSGTTLVTAREFQIGGIGFEANPFLAFVAKVKLTSFNQKEIEEIKKINKRLHELDFEPTIEQPKLSISEKLFGAQLKKVLMIKEYLKSIETTKIRDFFTLAYLSILEDASYAKKDGNGLRYPKNKTPKNVIEIFLNQVHLMIKDLEVNRFKNSTMTEYLINQEEEFDRRPINKEKIKFYLFEEDSRKINEIISSRIYNKNYDLLNGLPISKLSDFKESLALIVFSPPYMNCFDYAEIYKIELWFGEFIKEYKDLKKLRKNSLTSHMNKKFQSQSKLDNNDVSYFCERLEEKKLWNNRIPRMIEGYFYDMKCTLKGLYKMVKQGGHCIIVVGNSSYGNIAIPTDLILGNIGCQIGFDNCRIEIARHLGTSSQQHNSVNNPSILRESLVILEK